MILRFYRCSSVGTRNNGMVEECRSRHELEDGGSYNCPICAAPMTPEYSGPSVSDLLRKGYEKEKERQLK